MKFFFSQAVTHDNEGEVSTRGVKEEIKILIDEEDRSQPLSDKKIQLYFSNKGMHIARRTINKYRKTLHILPSYLRKM